MVYSTAIDNDYWIDSKGYIMKGYMSQRVSLLSMSLVTVFLFASSALAVQTILRFSPE